MNMIVMTIRGIMGGKHDWIYLTENKDKVMSRLKSDEIETYEFIKKYSN